MKKSDLGAPEFINKLFFENEVKNNRISAIVLFVIGAVYIVFGILANLGLYNLVSNYADLFLFLIGCLDIVAFIVAVCFKFSRRFIKFILEFAILLSCAVVYFYFPSTALFIVYGPIVISAMYFNTKFVAMISAVNYVIFALLTWANAWLERTNETMQLIHASLGETIWQIPSEVMLYRFLPHSIFFFITFYVCLAITTNGKSFVVKQAGMTTEISKIDAEISIASNIQKSSLPPDRYVSEDGTVRIDAVMRPAKTVGGDFYDYFEEGSNIVFLIGDVSDKGLSAAMFMMKAKNAIHDAVLGGKSLGEAIAEVNSTLCTDNAENIFVTLWVGSLNVKTGAGRYVNCGHLPPIIRHQDGTTETIENNPDILLGIFDDAVMSEHQFKLESNDTMFVFTDGLTDAVNLNKEAFGEDSLKKAIENIVISDENTCGKIVGIIDEFANGADQFDDMTAISVTIKGQTGSREDSITIKAKSGSASAAIDKIDALLVEIGCPEEARRDIDVAIDEVCENISEYAYPDGDGEYTVEFTAGESRIDFTVSDNGIPFNPLDEPDREYDEDRIGGLGIHLVRNIMDGLEYNRVGDMNQLKFYKTWDKPE